jgi:aspartate aminotransferase
MGMEEQAARRMGAVKPSATVMVSDKARAMAQEGIDVINLGGGDPDFSTPANIIEAAEEAMREGHTHYVSSRGVKGLLEALAEKLKTDNGLDFDPYTEIIVSPGAKLSLFSTIMATVDEGDEVLLLDPFWVSYEPMVQLANATPVRVPLDKTDNFRVTTEMLRSKLTAKTKMIILNSPNNPTGRVLSREELQVIADVAIENDLLVISDEIYEKILFDGHEHISIGTFPGMADRTIIINGFSKAYAMTGWRLGYAAARASLISVILKVQQHAATCAAAFVEHAGIAALTGPQDAVSEMVEVYRQRRDIITTGLNSLPGVSCRPIEGAFYAFADISESGLSSLEFADLLLEKAGVAVTPGMAFGASGEGHVRLSFANSTELIEKSIERMREVL